MYLAELARRDGLRAAICESVLDQRGPLFNDPREILEEEFRRPGTYFSLLEELAAGERGMEDLTASLRAPHSTLGPYLSELVRMQLVEKQSPLTSERDLRYRLRDDFLRFWFRFFFVFPFQESLRAGLAPCRSLRRRGRPLLAEHVAPVFERVCRRWVLRNLGNQATLIQRWWGRALDPLRAEGVRSTEEIDLIGVARSRVALAAECKWTNKKMSPKVLADLEELSCLLCARPAPASPRAGRASCSSRRAASSSRSSTRPPREDVQLIDLDQLDPDLGR